MECPTCRYPVPAEWSLCRRCGAPVHSEPEDATGGGPGRRSTTTEREPRRRLRRGSARGRLRRRRPRPRAIAAFAERATRHFVAGALPRPDNLLPRATRSTPAPAAAAATNRLVAANRSTNRRNALVRRPLAGALAAHPRDRRRRSRAHDEPRRGLAGAVPRGQPERTASSTGATSVAQAAHATALLRTVVGGGRSLYAAAPIVRRRVTAASLSAYSYRVPVVGPTQRRASARSR